MVAPDVSKQEKLNFLNIVIGTKETVLSRALAALVESEYNNKIKEKLFNELFKLKVLDILFPIFFIVVLKSKVGSFLNRFSNMNYFQNPFNQILQVELKEALLE